MGALISSSAPKALRRLGLNVEAPVATTRETYRRFLPVGVTGGYFSAIRRDLIAGHVRACDDQDQLRWTAAQLRVPAPSRDDPWPRWQTAWTEALRATGVIPPSELDEKARRVLLEELLERPAYQLRLVDSLAAAFLDQATRQA